MFSYLLPQADAQGVYAWSAFRISNKSVLPAQPIDNGFRPLEMPSFSCEPESHAFRVRGGQIIPLEGQDKAHEKFTPSEVHWRTLAEEAVGDIMLVGSRMSTSRKKMLNHLRRLQVTSDCKISVVPVFKEC